MPGTILTTPLIQRKWHSLMGFPFLSKYQWRATGEEKCRNFGLFQYFSRIVRKWIRLVNASSSWVSLGCHYYLTRALHLYFPGLPFRGLLWTSTLRGVLWNKPISKNSQAVTAIVQHELPLSMQTCIFQGLHMPNLPILGITKLCWVLCKKEENDPFSIDLPFDFPTTLDASVLSKFLFKLIYGLLSPKVKVWGIGWGSSFAYEYPVVTNH